MANSHSMPISLYPTPMTSCFLDRIFSYSAELSKALQVIQYSWFHEQSQIHIHHYDNQNLPHMFPNPIRWEYWYPVGEDILSYLDMGYVAAVHAAVSPSTQGSHDESITILFPTEAGLCFRMFNTMLKATLTSEPELRR